MKFGIKGFILFFLAVIGGSLAGGFVNGFLGIQSGADYLTYIIFMLVPVLLAYLLYENWLRKKAHT